LPPEAAARHRLGPKLAPTGYRSKLCRFMKSEIRETFMAQDDDDQTTGCCVVFSPNGPNGMLKFDDYTKQKCKEAGETFGYNWEFHPNTTCSSIY
jgi:hypothetical protein